MREQKEHFLKTALKLFLILLFIATLVYMYKLSKESRQVYIPDRIQVLFKDINFNIKDTNAKKFCAISFVFDLEDPDDGYLFREKTHNNLKGNYNRIRAEILKILLDKDLDAFTKGTAGVEAIADEIKTRVNAILAPYKKDVVKHVYITKLLIS